MTTGFPPPYAVFTGSLANQSTGTWHPAQATVHDGLVTLQVASAAGWQTLFSVPSPAVAVHSAAQRITLVLHGEKYVLLADPTAVSRAGRMAALNIAGHAFRAPAVRMGNAAMRGANQVVAARSFNAGGGNEFISAMRTSGAPVRRVGFGALTAIGCGAGLLVVIVVVFTVLFFTV